MKVIRMSYRDYKNHYSDCSIVSGSYRADTKSIEVEIPEGRMKASGTRGHRYLYLSFDCIRPDGSAGKITVQAISRETAIRQIESRYIGYQVDYK